MNVHTERACREHMRLFGSKRVDPKQQQPAAAAAAPAKQQQQQQQKKQQQTNNNNNTTIISTATRYSNRNININSINNSPYFTSYNPKPYSVTLQVRLVHTGITGLVPVTSFF